MQSLPAGRGRGRASVVPAWMLDPNLRSNTDLTKQPAAVAALAVFETSSSADIVKPVVPSKSQTLNDSNISTSSQSKAPRRESLRSHDNSSRRPRSRGRSGETEDGSGRAGRGRSSRLHSPHSPHSPDPISEHSTRAAADPPPAQYIGRSAAEHRGVGPKRTHHPRLMRRLDRDYHREAAEKDSQHRRAPADYRNRHSPPRRSNRSDWDTGLVDRGSKSGGKARDRDRSAGRLEAPLTTTSTVDGVDRRRPRGGSLTGGGGGESGRGTSSRYGGRSGDFSRRAGGASSRSPRSGNRRGRARLSSDRLNGAVRERVRSVSPHERRRVDLLPLSDWGRERRVDRRGNVGHEDVGWHRSRARGSPGGRRRPVGSADGKGGRSRSRDRRSSRGSRSGSRTRRSSRGAGVGGVGGGGGAIAQPTIRSGHADREGGRNDSQGPRKVDGVVRSEAPEEDGRRERLSSKEAQMGRRGSVAAEERKEGTRDDERESDMGPVRREDSLIKEERGHRGGLGWDEPKQHGQGFDGVSREAEYENRQRRSHGWNMGGRERSGEPIVKRLDSKQGTSAHERDAKLTAGGGLEERQKDRDAGTLLHRRAGGGRHDSGWGREGSPAGVGDGVGTTVNDEAQKGVHDCERRSHADPFVERGSARTVYRQRGGESDSRAAAPAAAAAAEGARGWGRDRRESVEDRRGGKRRRVGSSDETPATGGGHRSRDEAGLLPPRRRNSQGGGSIAVRAVATADEVTRLASVVAGRDMRSKGQPKQQLSHNESARGWRGTRQSGQEACARGNDGWDKPVGSHKEPHGGDHSARGAGAVAGAAEARRSRSAERSVSDAHGQGKDESAPARSAETQENSVDGQKRISEHPTDAEAPAASEENLSASRAPSASGFPSCGALCDRLYALFNSPLERRATSDSRDSFAELFHAPSVFVMELANGERVRFSRLVSQFVEGGFSSYVKCNKRVSLEFADSSISYAVDFLEYESSAEDSTLRHRICLCECRDGKLSRLYEFEDENHLCPKDAPMSQRDLLASAVWAVTHKYFTKKNIPLGTMVRITNYRTNAEASFPFSE